MVKYDGAALSEHRIDVRDLAPSLLALADALVIANELVGDGLTPPPTLEVVASAEGSFDVHLLLTVLEDAQGFLLSNPATAAVNALALLTTSFHGLSWLRERSRRGSEVSAVEAEPGVLRVLWPDGTVLSTTTDAAALVDSMDFRRSAREFASPLENRGVERIQLAARASRVPTVVLERSDLNGFDLPEPEDQVLNTTERTVILQLITVGLQSSHKWRVSDGSTPFWVSLDDLRFQMEVDAGVERFGRHDRLECVMRETQYQGRYGRLRVERSIREVLSHSKGPEQRSLLDPPDEDLQGPVAPQ